MTRKRQREEPGGPDDDAEGKARKEGADREPASRRNDMASIARRRAAHFAHFNDDDDVGEQNVHVGSDQARTLGPWSSAMELVNAREKAQHDRQARLQQEAGGGARGEGEAAAAGGGGEWRPSRDPSLGPHPRDRVRPLLARCVEVLTDHIDCVESLWGVPDEVRILLAASVCARRKMSAEVARLFAADSPGELVLPDCTQLDGAAMGELLGGLAVDKLQRLELGFCGRGFGDEAAAQLAGGGPLRVLEAVALEGAYRMSDAGLGKVLSAAPRLTRLAVPQCSRLTAATVDKLPELAPGLSHLNLADCRGVGADSLVAALPQLTALRIIRLDFIPEVDDGVLAAVGALPQLRELSIRCCQAVTDAGLTALAATHGSQLEMLRLDECGGNVTDRGIEALATQCRALRVFSARRCTRLGDLALAALLRAGSMRHLTLSGVPGVGPEVAGVLASHCRDTLEHLDMSFCRKIPDRSLGWLLDRCQRLRRLVVFGCSQLSHRSLLGHNNDQLVIDGLHTKAGLDLAAAASGAGEAGPTGGRGSGRAGDSGHDAGAAATGDREGSIRSREETAAATLGSGAATGSSAGGANAGGGAGASAKAAKGSKGGRGRGGAGRAGRGGRVKAAAAGTSAQQAEKPDPEEEVL